MLRRVLFSLSVLGLNARVMKNKGHPQRRNINQCDTSCSGWVENTLVGKQPYQSRAPGNEMTELEYDGISTHLPRRFRSLVTSIFSVLEAKPRAQLFPPSAQFAKGTKLNCGES
jgi:hypothetical protein